MASLSKKLLNSQAYVFLNAIDRFGQSASTYEKWVTLFIAFTKVEDASDIEPKDVDLFIQSVYDEHNGYYPTISARRAIEAFRRYYMARSKNAQKRLTRGRPPAIEKIDRVKQYRDKGLSFRDISKLTGSDVSLVYRWFKKTLNK